MKKSLLIFVLVFAFCFSACVNQNDGKDSDNKKETETYILSEDAPTDKIPQAEHATEATTVPLTEPETNAKATLPLPRENMDFYFSSGAGGWGTELFLNSDGTFSGIYTDSELGSTGEGYPNGSYYISDFSGRFTDIEKINDYSYRMKISDLKLKNEPGQEWIDDGVLYIASDPYGIDGGEEFILYLPHTPLIFLNEEFRMWWPYRFDEGAEAKTTMSCYGILNVNTNEGFFTYN